tara:strand:+ start:10210 stop:10332 length:123 start_codon:yes stop_codon:yes gene_type:complete
MPEEEHTFSYAEMLIVAGIMFAVGAIIGGVITSLIFYANL